MTTISSPSCCGLERETATIEEAIESFRRFGYDAEEAQFLTLAALHSGYFLRRQFNEFLGQERGGRASRFVEKLLAKRHAQVTRYPLNRLLYHIRGKQIYNRLGQRDNRNRREKAPLTIKRKLMCLDFALAHRGQRFLATEFEKVAYFTRERNTPVHDLPVRRYDSRTPGKATDRYFVDKLPIFVDGADASLSSPVVRFAYIDEGAESIAGFETFLGQYRALFTGLGRFEVVYVAGEPVWFQKAERLFKRFFPSAQNGSLVSLDPEVQRLLDFFEARRKFEARDFAGFDTGRIIQFREEKRRFADAAYDELYRRWLTEGEAALRPPPPSCESFQCTFRTLRLPYDYNLFGSLRRAS